MNNLKTTNYQKMILLFGLLVITGFLIIKFLTGEIYRREIFLTFDSSNSARVREVVSVNSDSYLYIINAPQVFGTVTDRDLVKVSNIDVLDAYSKTPTKIVLPLSNKKIIVFGDSGGDKITLNYGITNWGKRSGTHYNYYYRVKNELNGGIKIHQSFTNGYLESYACESEVDCDIKDIDQEVVYQTESLNGTIITSSSVVWNSDHIERSRPENRILSILQVYYLNLIIGTIILTALVPFVLSFRESRHPE